MATVFFIEAAPRREQVHLIPRGPCQALEIASRIGSAGNPCNGSPLGKELGGRHAEW
jgi:hypothetical protein